MYTMIRFRMIFLTTMFAWFQVSRSSLSWHIMQELTTWLGHGLVIISAYITFPWFRQPTPSKTIPSLTCCNFFGWCLPSWLSVDLICDAEYVRALCKYNHYDYIDIWISCIFHNRNATSMCECSGKCLFVYVCVLIEVHLCVYSC